MLFRLQRYTPQDIPERDTRHQVARPLSEWVSTHSFRSVRIPHKKDGELTQNCLSSISLLEYYNVLCH